MTWLAFSTACAAVAAVFAVCAVIWAARGNTGSTLFCGVTALVGAVLAGCSYLLR